MDRDVVNALHFLYQYGETKAGDLLSSLWCGPDSEPDLDALTERRYDTIRLNPHLVKFLKATEGQLANMPRPDFVFGFPLSQSPRKQGEPWVWVCPVSTDNLPLGHSTSSQANLFVL